MSKAANKDAVLIFRLSPHDKTAVAAKARRAKVSVSDFCRKAVLDKRIVYIDGLPAYMSQLSRISTNVNQIAIGANQGRDVSLTLPAIQARLCQSLDVIDRVLGGEDDSNSETD